MASTPHSLPRNGLSLMRTARGWTLKDLAAQLQCHRDSIARWERGERMPGLVYVQRYAQVFGVQESDIECAYLDQ